MERIIPSIICGEIKDGKDISLEYPTEEEEIEVLLPEVSDNDINKIKSSPRDIHSMHVDDIISFYSKVGELWRNKNYPLRKDAVTLASQVTGYHKAMIEHSYDFLCRLLSKEYLEHLIDAELRDRRFMDEWIKVKEAFVHAQPRGRILHILAGNAPEIGPLSMVRGNLTKNVNIIKLSRGDPVTSLYLALSFKDVDEDNPITKTTSVLYWEGGSEIGDKFIEMSNVICVWGGKEAVESIRRKSKYGTQLIEFGPRRSMQLIGKEAFKNLKEVTDRVAHDLVLYDQEACHSPQLAFIEGNAEKFCESLAISLEEEGKRLPKGYVPLEKHAQISHEKAIAKFYGEKVYSPKGTEWTLIISNDVKRTISHPLSRTLYVFKIKDMKEALKHIDESVQTVAVYPEEKIKELRDVLTLKGVDRVTHLGKMGYFALGAPHDGIYPLSHMIRWVKSK